MHHDTNYPPSHTHTHTHAHTETHLDAAELLPALFQVTQQPGLLQLPAGRPEQPVVNGYRLPQRHVILRSRRDRRFHRR